MQKKIQAVTLATLERERERESHNLVKTIKNIEKDKTNLYRSNIK